VRPYLKKKKKESAKNASGLVQVAECLLSKDKVCVQTSVPPQNKTKQKNTHTHKNPNQIQNYKTNEREIFKFIYI
jgi:hypothetical protein